MKFILKNKKLFAFAFWIWVGLILYFSFIPNNPNMMNLSKGSRNFRLDYLLHFLAYFSLAILFMLWHVNNSFKTKPLILIYFLIGSLVLSGLSEYLQIFIPGRTFNPNDFYSNTAGIFVGVIIPKFILK